MERLRDIDRRVVDAHGLAVERLTLAELGGKRAAHERLALDCKIEIAVERGDGHAVNLDALRRIRSDCRGALSQYLGELKARNAVVAERVRRRNVRKLQPVQHGFCRIVDTKPIINHMCTCEYVNSNLIFVANRTFAVCRALSLSAVAPLARTNRTFGTPYVFFIGNFTTRPKSLVRPLSFRAERS